MELAVDSPIFLLETAIVLAVDLLQSEDADVQLEALTVMRDAIEVGIDVIQGA